MKLFRLLMLLFAGSLMISSASGQANAFINVLTQNSGQVGLGGTVFIQVDVGNTGPASNIGVNKVRAQISVPSAIVSVLPSGQQTGLPPGWIITANTGSAITVCNGSDVITPGTQRTVLIAVQGNALGGPSTVAGVLSFGPGTGVCTGPGSLPGDNTADNTSTSSIQVIPAPACNLSLTASAGTITCNGGTTTLTATAGGASGAVEYSLNGGAFQSSNTFTVDAAGSPYTVTVREVANTSCTATASPVSVSQPAAINASASAGGPILCNGATTSLTVTASGGTGSLEYSLNGGSFQSGNVFTVPAGTYTVTVRDANSCTIATNSVTITQPAALIASSNAPPIALPGGSTTVTVSATGGTAPYTGTGTFTRTAGTYTFTVTDANGCTAETTITLNNPSPGQANAFINVLTLNSGQVNVGQVVDVQVSVGNTGPSFIGVNKVRAQISIPIAIATALPNAQQTGLPAGWIITANTGGSITICNGSDQIPAGEQRQILIKVQGTAAGGPSTVAGVLSFGPGTGVCTGPGSLPGDNTADNTSTSTIQVISSCSIGVTASAGAINCFGGTTTLTATASGAGGAVEYSLNGGAFQSANTFTVGAGTYTVTAREVATPSCSATSTAVTVAEPAAINASASAGTINCFGGSTTLTVTATGGTGALEYSLNGGAFQSANTFTVVAGTYTVTVRDANSCTVNSNSVTVGQPSSAITASVAAGAAILCNGGTTTLTVTASGGTAPLEYSLNGGAFQSSNTFNVGAGSHTVTVRDANGCTATTNSVSVTQPTALIATSNAAPIALPGGSTTVTVGANGGTAPYTGTGTFTRTAGTYTFTVTDANGCTASTTITLADPTPGQANAFINVLTLNSGQVNVGDVVDVQVSVGNTGPSFIGVNKVRAQISIPIAIATALPNAQQTGLPAGWIITANTGGTITVCNGSDQIPAGSQRQILIKVQGTAAGGPSTVAGVLSFGPGTGVCTGPGSLPGDNTADNTSTSTIQVISTCNIGVTAFAGTIACNGGTTTLTATATGAGGAVEYSLNGGAFQSSNVFTVGAGTYTITAREVATPACSATSGAVTVSQPAAITASASAGSIACNGGTTVLTVTASGGTGTLEYSLNGGTLQSGNTFTVSAGTYTVTVRDANACTATTSSLTVSQPVALAATATSTPVTTIGGTDGTATAVPSGGTSPYTYSWNTTPVQTGVTATGLAAGSYTVTVTDANGCTTTATTTVGSPACNLSATAAAGLITCNGGTTTLTATATGGNAPLQYSLNGGAFQSGNTFTVGAGTYTVTVKDAANCEATTNTVTVTAPAALIASASAGTIACNGGTTVLTVTASGGTGTLEYGLNGGAFQSGNTFTVSAGTYTVTVRDANACTATASSVTVSQPAAITASASAGSILCNGGTTTLTVTASGGTAPLEYSLNGGAFQSSNTFTVSAGTYTVTVRDANACTATTNSVTVSQPVALAATATSTPVTTIGGTDGTATAAPSGGTAPYTYSWNTTPVQTGVTATGLVAGSYTVTVTDANGCTTTATTTVGSPACNLSATAVAGLIACNGGTTTLTVTAAGGNAPLQYSLNGGAFQSGNTFTVVAGTYTVTVKDAANCEITTNTVTLSQPAVLTASASAGTVGCNGGTTTLTVIANGGTEPFEYSLNGGAFQSANTFTVNAAGSPYTVTVRDASGCTAATNSVSVSQPTAITASAVAGAAILCNGGTTTLTVTASGGTAPYEYSRNGGAFQSGNVFTVNAGTHAVTVRDANGCTAATTAVTITQPTSLIATSNAAPIALPGGSSTINVGATGGTAPYTGTGSFVRTAGTYTFTVTDANGCTAITTITLVDPTPGQANAFINVLTLNSGQVNVGDVVDVQVSVGNTGPSFIGVNKVRAQISIPSAIATALPNAQQIGLPAGWIILNNTGGAITICNGSDQIPAGAQRQILIKVQGVAAGGPSTIAGVLSFGPGTGVCTGPGSLPGDMTADNTSTSTIQVISTCNIGVTTSAGTIACNGGTTTLTATASGTSGAVEYSLNGGAFQSGNTFTVPAGTYTVTVREVVTPACTATSSAVTVTEPAAINVSASAGTINCFGESTTLTVAATGGTGSLEYSLNGGAFQSGNTFSIAAGTYTVTVRDANACTATSNSVTVTQPAAVPAPVAGAITQPTCAAPSGSVVLSGLPSGNWTITRNPGNATTSGTGESTTISGLAPGSYTFTVTNAAGCVSSASASVVINPVPADNINPTITAPAAITVNTNDGCTATGVVLGTPVTADNCGVASVTNNAPAAFPLGTTTVTWTVTDASGNTATATQTVTVTDNVKPVIFFAGSALLQGTTGTGSSQTPYMLPTVPGAKFTSLISVNDLASGYRMAGLADGLGAFDNNNGTFTLLVNHEMQATLGVVRAHGSRGAFVSKWVIDKSTLAVQSGSDLMQRVFLWNGTGFTQNTFAFGRFCSADLPSVSAFYNHATGKGTLSRIFMNGEETGVEGKGVAHVVTGPEAGDSYELPYTGKFSWENSVASPFAQDKTIVVGLDDGLNGQVYVYVGTKTNSGIEIEKAGLNNGKLFGVKVTGLINEVSATVPAPNTPFALFDHGFVQNTTGATLDASSEANQVTSFIRPEDGAWDPSNPGDFYFVTTNAFNSPSRLWRLRFSDITNPEAGGNITAVLDGTEGQQMLDNLTIDKHGHILLQEDPGNQNHNAKMWQYTIATDQLTLIGKHDPARFGDLAGAVVTPATAPFNRDEESSGIIDVSDILGAGMFLVADQGHYTPAANAAEVVEGGQLLAFFNPASISASVNAAPDTIRSCTGTGIDLGTPATADNCSVASVTNDAPATFPAGTTTVTWTVTDGSGNTATATQIVIVTSVAAPVAGAITHPSCEISTGSVVLSGLPSGNWTITRNPGGVTTTGTGATTTISGLAPGTYTFTVTSGNCTSDASANVVINNAPDAPAAPTVNVAQPTCTVANGTITITSSTSDLTFSLDGGAYAAYPAGGYVVAAGSHTLAAQNAAGCISAVVTINVNAQPATPAAPVVGVIVHPGCTVATGSVTLTDLPSGNWTLNPGNITGTGSSFTISGLAPGTYNYTVTNEAGCISASSADVVINAQPPAVAGPTVNVAQPTCAVATGAITVTSSTAGLTFSFDGGAYVAYPAGGYVVAAGSHTLSAQNADGCISPVTSITVNAQPASPAAPAVNVAQPTCAVATGTITVTSSTAGLTFSLDGGAYAAYPAGGYVVAAGSHTLSAQNAAGCISAVTDITVNAQPATPAAPTTDVVNPTCAVATGTITITSSTAGLTFSLDGGAYAAYPPAGYTVAAGSHTLAARNTAGCTSAVTTVTVNAQPASPAAPSVNVAQPTCAVATGTITVTSSTSGLTFSLDGSAYAAYHAGGYVVASGSHTLTAQNAAGCISAVTNITVNAQPATPAAPTAGAVTQPTCTVATGSVVLSGLPSGNWTITRNPGGVTTTGTGASTTISGLAAGIYTFTISNAAGCTSAASADVVINAQPAVPSAPVVGTITQPSACFATASVVLSGLPSGNWTITRNPGGVTTTGTGETTTISGLGSGAYTFTVTSNGCTSSASANVVINAQPAALAVTTTSTPATVGANGTATANVTGGTAPYTYLWTPGAQTTATATSLAAGIYTVVVTDARGCEASATVTVTAGCGVIASAGPDQKICNGVAVTLTATGTGGVITSPAGPQPFAEVAGSTADTRIFSGNIDYLTIGNTFSRSEARTDCGQIVETTATLNIPAGAVVKKAYLYWSGSGSGDNTVKINTPSMSGGSYTNLSADNMKTDNISGVGTFFGARKDITSLVTASGIYKVKDLTWSSNSSYCQWNGAYGAWGMVVIYESSSLPTSRIHVNTEKFDMTYPAGTYSTTINNINVPAGCTPNAKLTIMGFEGDKYKGENLRIAGVLDADSNNFRGQNGPNFDIITRNAPSIVPGTTSLTYSIQSYLTSSIYGPAIEAMFDYVKVLKYNHCPPGNCNGYKYEWKRNGTVVGTTQSINTSTPGTYTVKVTDCNNCSGTDEVVVSTSTLAATSTVTTPVACNGGDATVTVAATGGVAPYTGTGTFTKTAGTHIFTVTDAKGCKVTTTVAITQPSALVATVTAPQVPCGSTTTTVTVSATGGTAPYSGTGSYSRPVGTHTFTVVDAKGCTKTVSVVVTAASCGPVDPNKCYKLIARHSGKTLTVEGSSTWNGGNIEQRSYNGGDNQIWRFELVQTGYYKIVNTNSGKVLDVQNGSTSNGANIQQWTYGGGDNQKWSLTANGAYFVVKAKHSGKAMSIAGASTSNGADAEQRGTGGNTNEQWQFVEVDCHYIAKGQHPGFEPKEEELRAELEVTAMPNPSTTDFTLNIRSADHSTPIMIRVSDVNGKQLSVSQSAANSTIKVGSARWTSGIYFAEVIQGNQRKVVKLIKAN